MPKDAGEHQGDIRASTRARYQQLGQGSDLSAPGRSSTFVFPRRRGPTSDNAIPREQGIMFGGARDLAINGGSFFAGVLNQTYMLPPNSIPSGDSGNTQNPHSGAGTYSPRRKQSELWNACVLNRLLSIVSVKKSQDIYYEHIGVLRRGSPLWNPEPNQGLPLEYQRRGVMIGDVGLITASGSFDFLFNIFLPRNHPINPTNLPDNFSAFHPISPADIDSYAEFTGENHLSSGFIKTTRRQSSSDDLSLIFEASSSTPDGAILVMPVGSNSTDVAGLSGLRRFVANHAEDWYCYGNMIRSREMRNGDLRVVIGHDKTTAWGIATFQNINPSRMQPQEPQDPYIFKFQSVEVKVPQTNSISGKNYVWEYSAPSAQARTGPYAEWTRKLSRGDCPQAEGKQYKNQTLFVRTMNITLQDQVWQGQQCII